MSTIILDTPSFAIKEGVSLSSELHVDTFTLPGYLGSIKDSFKAPASDGIIIHIQDAHCNYAGQRKIAEIVQYLKSKYGVSVVNLEGGSDEYNLSTFSRIPDAGIRERVSDSFVKDGLVNGAEYFAVNNPGAVTLWGVEDTKLYMENLNVYRRSLEYKDQVDNVLKSLGYILSNLKRHIYSPELLNFDAAYARYKVSHMEFKDYMTYLTDTATKLGIDIASFRSLSLFRQTLETEAMIDFRQADLERERMIDELQKRLSRNAISELVMKSVEFKAERLPPQDFYAYLKNQAAGVSIDLARYPQLDRYMTYIALYGAIDRVKMMEEIVSLEDAIKGRLIRNDTERELAGLSKNLVLLKNLFAISLTKDDYRYVSDNAASFEARRFTDFINAQAPRYKITAQVDPDIAHLDGWRADISGFYDWSLKRDLVFLEKIRYSESPQKSAVIVTGGFHTENLCKLFRERGMSFVSIMPNFRMEAGYESPYFGLLTGKLQGRDKRLYTAVSSMAGGSAIQIASMLNAIRNEAWGQAAINTFDILAAVRQLNDLRIPVVLSYGDQTFDYGEGTENALRMSVKEFLKNVQEAYVQDANETKIDPMLQAVYAKKGEGDAVKEVSPQSRQAAADRMIEMAKFVKDGVARKKLQDLARRVQNLNINTVNVVKYGADAEYSKIFDGHAGGMGINVNMNKYADGKIVNGRTLEDVVLHELVSGITGNHFIAQNWETATRATATQKEKDAAIAFLTLALNRTDAFFDVFITDMTSAQRAAATRDMAGYFGFGEKTKAVADLLDAAIQKASGKTLERLTGLSDGLARLAEDLNALKDAHNTAITARDKQVTDEDVAGVLNAVITVDDAKIANDNVIQIADKRLAAVRQIVDRYGSRLGAKTLTSLIVNLAGAGMLVDRTMASALEMYDDLYGQEADFDRIIAENTNTINALKELRSSFFDIMGTYRDLAAGPEYAAGLTLRGRAALVPVLARDPVVRVDIVRSTRDLSDEARSDLIKEMNNLYAEMGREDLDLRTDERARIIAGIAGIKGINAAMVKLVRRDMVNLFRAMAVQEISLVGKVGYLTGLTKWDASPFAGLGKAGTFNRQTGKYTYREGGKEVAGRMDDLLTVPGRKKLLMERFRLIDSLAGVALQTDRPAEVFKAFSTARARGLTDYRFLFDTRMKDALNGVALAFRGLDKEVLGQILMARVSQPDFNASTLTSIESVVQYYRYLERNKKDNFLDDGFFEDDFTEKLVKEFAGKDRQTKNITLANAVINSWAPNLKNARVGQVTGVLISIRANLGWRSHQQQRFATLSEPRDSGDTAKMPGPRDEDSAEAAQKLRNREDSFREQAKANPADTPDFAPNYGDLFAATTFIYADLGDAVDAYRLTAADGTPIVVLNNQARYNSKAGRLALEEAAFHEAKESYWRGQFDTAAYAGAFAQISETDREMAKNRWAHVMAAIDEWNEFAGKRDHAGEGGLLLRHAFDLAYMKSTDHETGMFTKLLNEVMKDKDTTRAAQRAIVAAVRSLSEGVVSSDAIDAYEKKFADQVRLMADWVPADTIESRTQAKTEAWKAAMRPDVKVVTLVGVSAADNERAGFEKTRTTLGRAMARHGYNADWNDNQQVQDFALVANKDGVIDTKASREKMQTELNKLKEDVRYKGKGYIFVVFAPQLAATDPDAKTDAADTEAFARGNRDVIVIPDSYTDSSINADVVKANAKNQKVNTYVDMESRALMGRLAAWCKESGNSPDAMKAMKTFMGTLTASDALKDIMKKETDTLELLLAILSGKPLRVRPINYKVFTDYQKSQEAIAIAV